MTIKPTAVLTIAILLLLFIVSSQAPAAEVSLSAVASRLAGNGNKSLE
jgi:hypothetical protein